MTTYSTLIAAKTTEGSIKNWINNDKIPSTTVLIEAQTLIYTMLRHRFMLTSSTGAMGTTTAGVSLPADYIAARTLYYSGTDSGKVERKTLDYIEAQRAYDSAGALITGKPKYFHTLETTAEFELTPDKAYSYRMIYYRKPANLGTATETNFLTERMPDLIRTACLVKANEFLKDEGERAYGLGLFTQVLGMHNVESDDELRDLNAAMISE